MDWKKLMRRAYYEGIADGLSGYRAEDREERVDPIVDNIIREEVASIKEMAISQAIATLVKTGFSEETAIRMIEQGTIQVSDDGLDIEISIRTVTVPTQVMMNIVAPGSLE